MTKTKKNQKVSKSKILEIDIHDVEEDESPNDSNADPFLDVPSNQHESVSFSEEKTQNKFHFLHNEELNESQDTNKITNAVRKTKISRNDPDKKLIRIQKKNAKKNRETGKSYLGYRRNGNTVKQDVERGARIQRMTCLSNLCRRSALKHCNLFSENERQTIFNLFWQMSWMQKRMYVCNLVKFISKKSGTSTRRSHSREYFLIKSDNKEYRVCQKMFFNTLGLNEKMVRIWLKSKLSFGFFEHPDDVKAKILMKRRQGEKYQENQDRKLYLQDFLIKFPKLESHYCRKDTEKEYLQTEHRTLTDVYKDYLQFCALDNVKKLSVTVFSKIFQSMKYSLFKPRKDQCDDCIAYKVGNLSEAEFQKHRDEIDAMRKEKENDISDAIKHLITLLCMDVEAVQLCPKLKASALYFKLKLQMHNFTIYDILSHESMNYVWDETEGELKASIFTSIIIYHLEKLIAKKLCRDTIVILSDGCGYQNRNAILSSALCQFAMKHAVTIIQKFLVKGHTQMECDSSHALIERATRNKTINLPSDFIAAIQTARANPFPLGVQSLSHEFFLNYDDPNIMMYSSIRPGIMKCTHSSLPSNNTFIIR